MHTKSAVHEVVQGSTALGSRCNTQRISGWRVAPERRAGATTLCCHGKVRCLDGLWLRVAACRHLQLFLSALPEKTEPAAGLKFLLRQCRASEPGPQVTANAHRYGRLITSYAQCEGCDRACENGWICSKRARSLGLQSPTHPREACFDCVPQSDTSKNSLQ